MAATRGSFTRRALTSWVVLAKNPDGSPYVIRVGSETEAKKLARELNAVAKRLKRGGQKG